MVVQLPGFAGYTVDWRLQEFRRVTVTKRGQRRIEFVPFASAKGKRLLKRMQAEM